MPNANQKVLFKFGTAAQYAALETKQSNALYFLLDTNELYRGEIPFGQPHVYTGSRQSEQTDTAAIAAIVNNNAVVQGDIVVIQNADTSADAFIYSASNDSWIHIGNTTTDSIVSRVTALESQVADLTSLLNGTPADPQQGIEAEDGLVDRVSDLETSLAALQSAAAGAFHFKGTVNDITLVVNPSEGDVYQVGDKEYAWNGSNWVELGGQFDLSNYVTQPDFEDAIADLEALIGEPATSETDPNTGEETVTPATGIYGELAAHADQIIPLFNGAIAGLVPVDDQTLTTGQLANRFLNALGNWVTVSTSGGQTTYTAPDNTTFNNVEDYVTYMINTYGAEQIWESIDGN